VVAVVVLLILAGVLVLNTMLLRPAEIVVETVAGPAIDIEAAASRLAGALRIETVSYQDRGLMDPQAFRELHAYLESSFPLAHATLQRETVAELSLLYTWPGTDPALKPVLLLAHQDVVPVEAESVEGWSFPPFAGELRDGFVGGRGGLDDKSGVLGIMEAVELLLRQGFQPERTVLLAFSHDEEIGGGEGAHAIAELLASRGVELEYLLDEGGAYLDGLVSGVAVPVAAIAVAEKGYLSVELTVQSTGGHSSNPPPETAITILANAVRKISESPFKPRLTGPGREFLKRIAPELPFSRRLLIANLWLFEPVLARAMASGGATASTVRTTIAPTMFHAGVKDNVLPKRAQAVINLRILPGDTVAGVLEHIVRAADDDRVSVQPIGGGQEPSPVSSFETAAYAGLERSIRRAHPHEGLIVSPFLLPAGTDSKHYTSLTDQVYRFRGFSVTPASIALAHGTDERISVEDYGRVIRVFYEVLLSEGSGS
jgi:carboxypeptidase PM20D1